MQVVKIIYWCGEWLVSMTWTIDNIILGFIGMLAHCFLAYCNTLKEDLYTHIILYIERDINMRITLVLFICIYVRTWRVKYGRQEMFSSIHILFMANIKP